MRLISVLCLVAACNGLTGGGPDPVQPPPAGIPPVAPPVVPPADPPPAVDPAPTCGDVANRAEEVLTERCSACHGPDSAAYKGFDDATDAKGLVSDGWVVPNDSANSPIFIQIDAGSMPTDEALVPEEREVIQVWIDCGAEDWAGDGAPAGVRGFVPPEALYQAALDDVNDIDEDVDASQNVDDRVNARYLSFVHLYNAGVSTEEIERFATGLNKLIWSLTRENEGTSVTPVQLDGIGFDDGGGEEDAQLQIADGLGDKLLFRVDMKEFAWEAAVGEVDVWEEMLKLYPLAIAFDQEFDEAENLVEETKTRIPIMNADWFLGNASQPPLYFDILDIPDTIDGFLQEFGGIASLDEAVLTADCAAMDAQETLVSNFNRVACRFDSNQGYCYASFDFASQDAEQDIFANPDLFAQNEDGGEAFCSLDNGQQVYLVYAAAGNRLDRAPIAVVSDFTPGSGGEVITGLSCFNCHSAGVIERNDQLLDFVLDNDDIFEDATIAFVEDLFPTNEDWADIYADDVTQFTRSLDEMVPVVDVVGIEPIYSAYREYDDTVTLARVAAELGVPEEVLEFQIESDNEVNQELGILLTTGKIDRQSFESDARDIICALELGGECDEALFCGLSAVPCVAGSVCDAQGQCSRID